MLSSCPSASNLQALFDGCLAEQEAVRVGAHVDECPSCQDALQKMTTEIGNLAICARNGRAKTMTVEPALLEAMEVLKESPLATAEFPDDEVEDFTAHVLRPAEKPGVLGMLGSYEIVESIGTGGMGRVYKALDPSLNRYVAIKIIAPQLSTSRGARKRFAREARAAAAINHENVVQIYSVPEVDGIPYLVMEYVPGMSLQQKIDQRSTIELEEILRIGQQAAAGLAAAHAQGLIHRDIKPANILLERGQDRVKITDFGLARMVDDASLTQSGVLAGTPQYMAPEQARGEAQDHRVDLFSLGSVLYTLCTGIPPFRANTTMAVLRQVSDQDPEPIRNLNSRVPTWLCAIIAKLHEKDPADRFQTAKSVADLLGNCLAHVQDPVRFPMPEFRDRRSILGRRILKPTSRAAILGFLVALVCAVGFWQGWQAFSRISHAEGTVAQNAPIDPSVVPGNQEEDSFSSDLAAAGLNNKDVAEKLFNRLLKEKQSLEAKLRLIKDGLERVSNQIMTSKTGIESRDSSKTNLSVRLPVTGRSPTPHGLPFPKTKDARVIAVSPDGSHLAVAEGDDEIVTFKFVRQRTPEYWFATLPQLADPVQAQVLELRNRFQEVSNENPRNLESRVWENALSETLQEYLDRIPKVLDQRQRLDRLQKQLNAISKTHDGKGFGEIRNRLNQDLANARNELDQIRDRLREELRRGVMKHVESQYSDALGIDANQLKAIEELIRNVNLEAQGHKARPVGVFSEAGEWAGDIRREHSFKTKCQSISCLAYAADGQYLIGSGSCREVFVWDSRTGEEVCRMKGHDSPTIKIESCAQSQQVVLCSADARLRVWSPGTREMPPLVKDNKRQGLREFSASSSGEWLTFLTQSELQGWQLDDGELTKAWALTVPHGSKCLSVTPDQEFVACLTSKNTVQIFDGETGKKIRTLKKGDSEWTCVAFAPQADSLVVGSRDGNIYYYDIHNWQLLGHAKLEGSWPVSFSVTPNARLIGVRQADGHACLAPLFVQTWSKASPAYSAVEVGSLYPNWFGLLHERIFR